MLKSQRRAIRWPNNVCARLYNYTGKMRKIQVEKMAYDMLHDWRQREKEHATVDRLIEALEKAQCKKLVKGVQARSQSYHFRVAA